MNRTLLAAFSAAALTGCAAVFLLLPHDPPMVRLVNALFLSGMGFFLAGLFRLTRRLHLYDLPLYSVKKLSQVLRDPEALSAEIPLGDYADYRRDTSYSRPCLELLTVGGALLLACALLIFCL